MSEKLSVLALQMTSAKAVAENLLQIEELLKNIDLSVVDLIVIPEMFAQFAVVDQLPLATAEQNFNGPVGQQIRQWARDYSVYIVAGTLPTLTADDARPRARCHVVDPQGELVCHYDKIHLFDAEVNDQQGHYRESDSYSPGCDVVSFDLPWGRIGLAVCYDLRFPELFRALADAGCDAVILPSAFTEKTGAAHWEVLVRARAIENGFYMLAVNQWGQHTATRATYGHSMLVNPWGEVDDAGVGLLAKTFVLDKSLIAKTRQQLPVLQHRRLK